MKYTVWLDWIGVKLPVLPGEMPQEAQATGYQVGLESSLASAREHYESLRKVQPSSLGEDGYPKDAIKALRDRGEVYLRYTVSVDGRVIEEVWTVDIP